MKVEYLDDITGGGQYPHADPERLIRLYEFDSIEAQMLKDAISKLLSSTDGTLFVSQLEFITAINCSLIFQVAEGNLGISLPDDKINFTCRLPKDQYEEMILVIDMFTQTENECGGFNWLYDPEPDKVDLLLSPAGSW
jgi:hypothetical protein